MPRRGHDTELDQMRIRHAIVCGTTVANCKCGYHNLTEEERKKMAKTKDSRITLLREEFDLSKKAARALMDKIKEKTGQIFLIQELEEWLKDKKNWEWAYQNGTDETPLEDADQEEEDSTETATAPAPTTAKIGEVIQAKEGTMTQAQAAIYATLEAARKAGDKDLQKKIRRQLRKSGYYLSGGPKPQIGASRRKIDPPETDEEEEE